MSGWQVLYHGKGRGITHLNEGDCEAAHPNWEKPVIDRDSDEGRELMERATRLLESADWTFAKTMPETPHFWTIPKKWDDRDDFAYCVMAIRTLGELVRYKGWKYVKLRANGWEYWDMDPQTCSPHSCDLINRARFEPVATLLP